jgi:hypothetical protein
MDDREKQEEKKVVIEEPFFVSGGESLLSKVRFL